MADVTCPHCGGKFDSDNLPEPAPTMTPEEMVRAGREDAGRRKPKYTSYPAVAIGIRGYKPE